MIKIKNQRIYFVCEIKFEIRQELCGELLRISTQTDDFYISLFALGPRGNSGTSPLILEEACAQQ